MTVSILEEYNAYLAKLLGRRLASIQFGLDYKCIRFDGPELLFYDEPILQIGEKIFNSSDIEFNYQMVSLIFSQVWEVDYKRSEYLKIFFPEDRNITILLEKSDSELRRAVVYKVDRYHVVIL